MSSQVLDLKAEPTQPFMLRDILPGPAWSPYVGSTQPVEKNDEYEPGADVRRGSCIKGLVMGVVIEGTMALCIYGAWQTFHLIR